MFLRNITLSDKSKDNSIRYYLTPDHFRTKKFDKLELMEYFKIIYGMIMSIDMSITTIIEA